MNLFLRFLSAFLIAIIINGIISFGLSPFITIPSDTFRNVSELISTNGYPVENHIVETADGYLLSVQRIPYGKKQPEKIGQRPVVLLLHALLFSSAEWVWNSPEQSLGFILADNGYDVWMGNNRGNTYSRSHVSLSPRTRKFWDFSYDEMAKFDVPAMIDYILNKTQANQLSLIGHSRGTTMGFAMLSENQNYNKKINIFITLAPAGTIAGIKGAFGVISYLQPIVQSIYNDAGHFEILPNNFLIKLFSLFCGTPARFLCADLLFSFYGYNPKQLNYTRLPLYFAHTPAGISFKDLLHYGQTVFSAKFRKYDYYEDNPRHYNQSTPPEYDISKITTPVALISGENDVICNPTVVGRVRQGLKSVVSDIVVPGFNHGDFAMAIDANKLVYRKILSLLEQYSN